MLLRGLWAIVPGRSRSRPTQCTSNQSSAARRSRRAPASASGGPSATWMWTPTPRSRGQAGGRRERVVGARERGVDADEAAPAGAQEALVLGQAATGAVGAVAVGDAVGADDADADLGTGVGDDVEAALDGVRALVVIDDAGRPGEQRFDGAEPGARSQHVEVEGGVEPPPHLLEDLQEVVGRRRRRRHPARQRRVQVVMGTHEPRGGRAHGGQFRRLSALAPTYGRVARKVRRSAHLEVVVIR